MLVIAILQVIMAEVEVDENGLPTGDLTTKMGHFKGSLIRTHIPISYQNWRQVPMKDKMDVWRQLKVYPLKFLNFV